MRLIGEAILDGRSKSVYSDMGLKVSAIVGGDGLSWLPGTGVIAGERPGVSAGDITCGATRDTTEMGRSAAPLRATPARRETSWSSLASKSNAGTASLLRWVEPVNGGLSLLYDWTESACICGCMMKPFFNECTWVSRIIASEDGSGACLWGSRVQLRTLSTGAD